MMTPKASAQGSLAKTPFELLLLNLNAQRLTGTLALWPDRSGPEGSGQDRLFFQEGHLVAIRPLEPCNNLLSAVTRLFERREAMYAFYAGQQLVGSGPGALVERLDLYTILSSGLRSHARPEVVEAMLTGPASRMLRVRASWPAARFTLNAQEQALLELLRAGPDTAESLVTRSELPRADALRALYFLSVVQGVETVEAAQPAAPVDAAPKESSAEAANAGEAGASAEAAKKPTGVFKKVTLADAPMTGLVGVAKKTAANSTGPMAMPKKTPADGAPTHTKPSLPQGKKRPMP